MTAFSFDTIHAEPNPIAWIKRYSAKPNFISHGFYLLIKRGIDLAICTLALPAILPLFLLCIILIKLDSPGAPALFTQYRTGRNGRRFRMYKFRTMVPNAEEMKQQLTHLNELQWPDFKITRDPRITRVGRILRKTSLDELPQLLNVLKGDMTLVGPRPTSFAASTYRLWQTERLDVTPGLTGLWQIYGRACTEFDERLRLDITYIQNQCLAVDVEIMVRTVAAIFKARGAH